MPSETTITENDRVQWVAAVPMFEKLDPSQADALANLLRSLSFTAGEVIFHQRDPGDSMYIVRSGRVRIWVVDEDLKEVTLAELEPGAFFGELSLLDGSSRSANATAAEDSELLRLSKSDFHEFMLKNPVVALGMMSELGTRLRQTTQLVSQRATRNLNEEMEERMSLGDRIADRIASFGGSWPFIILFGGVLLSWIGLNLFLVFKHTGGPFNDKGSFDPYPFIALNLMLSMTAAFQAPIIMMSQNRAGKKDRLAAEIDFKVNLKSEMMLEELTRRMDRLQNEQIEELLEIARLARVVEAHIEEQHEEIGRNSNPVLPSK
jgi:CRP/FNR family transcriptional regulator, cyclic AMP receptor protein